MKALLWIAGLAAVWAGAVWPTAFPEFESEGPSGRKEIPIGKVLVRPSEDPRSDPTGRKAIAKGIALDTGNANHPAGPTGRKAIAKGIALDTGKVNHPAGPTGRKVKAKGIALETGKVNHPAGPTGRPHSAKGIALEIGSVIGPSPVGATFLTATGAIARLGTTRRTSLRSFAPLRLCEKSPSEHLNGLTPPRPRGGVTIESANSAPTLTLAAVGDVMLGRWVGKRIAKEGADKLFAGFHKELSLADMTFANLECALTNSTRAAHKKIVLKADTALAAALSRAGFSVLSLANNHALDYGQAGLGDTVSALKEANLLPIGISPDPLVWELKGLKVGFLAYCDFPKDSGGKGIQYTDEETLAADISLAKQQGSDVVVVAWHWGTEGSAKPTLRQRRLARLAADSGADLILGSHPHVLQPVEWLKRKDGRRCLVAYSLGNFVFDSVKEEERRTAILIVTLGKGGVRGFRLTPYRISRGAPLPTSSRKLPLRSPASSL